MQSLQANPIDISSLSVLSANRIDHSKCSPSTQPQQSPSQNSLNCCQPWNGEYTRRLAKVNRQIQRIQRIQEETQSKFKQYIDFMLAEAERNNDNNARLAREVAQLRQEIHENSKDIAIIERFMRTSSKRQTKAVRMDEVRGESRAGRDLLGSMSRSKNLLLRRTQGKLFRSKLNQRQ